MQQLEIIQAGPQDLPQILAIYARAREFMRNTGNPNQWKDGHPSEALLGQDLAQRCLYVLKDSTGIHAVFHFSIGPDPTYAAIEGGHWCSDAPYGVLHRVAGDGSIHGILPRIVDFCAQKIPHLRIDTHQDNLIMQHQIQKCGFQYCGVIRLPDGSPRLAYERQAESR